MPGTLHITSTRRTVEPPPRDRAYWDLRAHALTYHRLDLWTAREGIDEPELRGHAYGLIDKKGKAVFLTNSLDELRRRLRID